MEGPVCQDRIFKINFFHITQYVLIERYTHSDCCNSRTGLILAQWIPNFFKAEILKVFGNFKYLSNARRLNPTTNYRDVFKPGSDKPTQGRQACRRQERSVLPEPSSGGLRLSRPLP
jgi:hypothetical protein